MGGAAPALADAVVQEATPSGAECQHPNAKSEQIQEWGDMRSVGSNTHHQHQIKNYERWVCPDCEKEVAKDYVGEEWVDEAHSYANGVWSALALAVRIRINKTSATQSKRPEHGMIRPLETTAAMWMCISNGFARIAESRAKTMWAARSRAENILMPTACVPFAASLLAYE